MSFGRVMRVTAFRQPTAAEENEAAKFFGEVVTSVEVTAQDVQFSIEKSIGKDPNTCTVTILNLSEATRSVFTKRPLRVHLEAGYESDGGPKLLFVGDVRPGSLSRHQGTEWETKLLLADGGRAFAEARVSKSYKRGTPTHTILRDVAKALGLTLAPAINSSPLFKSGIATGEAAVGYASDVLTRVLAPFALGWSIQNGQLQILGDDEARPGVYVLEDGIIEEPEFSTPEKDTKPPLLHVKHELFPELLPGTKIEVRSRAIKGMFKLKKVKHNGDTAGKEWMTEVEALAL